jgi:predicted fused transcriptional regulator/phosphomethylpyrimidine kinase/predicted transcriptional regulator
MTLQLPSEIVVDRFLPTARSMLAVELDERGLAQQEIATKLGISQAAVSKYLSGKQTGEPRFADNPRMVETIEYIAEGFATGTLDDYEALSELLDLIRAFEDRGPICAVHEEEMPTLEGMGCDLCVRGQDKRLQAERDVLRDVRHAVRVFSNTPAVVDHIPNVGSNIGMALPEADSQTDIAAVPGRVHAMRGRVNVPSNPEFGASENVATTLLAVMAVDPSVRGAVNLATSDELLTAAAEQGLAAVAFDASYENRAERIQSLLEDRERVPRILYHEGAFGIEPITYVFGDSAVDAVETAISCLGATD